MYANTTFIFIEKCEPHMEIKFLKLRYVIIAIFTVITALSLSAWPKQSFAKTSQEELQAVYLYNFLSYVTWNDSAQKTICVYKNKHMLSLLKSIQNKKKDMHEFNVQGLKNLERTNNCNIIYLEQNKFSINQLKNLA